MASNKDVDGDHHNDTVDRETCFSMSISLESECIILDSKDESIQKGCSRVYKSNSDDHTVSSKHSENDTVTTSSTMSTNQSICSDPSTSTPSSSAPPCMTSSRVKVDEEALRIGKILSEQEFLFGFNMYDIPRTEEDVVEINRLVQVHTCSQHQALLVLFEKKYSCFRPKVHHHRQQHHHHHHHHQQQQQKVDQQLHEQKQQQKQQQQEHQQEHQHLSHQQMTEEQKVHQLFQQLCTIDPQQQHEQQQLELEARLVSSQLEKSFKGLSSSRLKSRGGVCRDAGRDAAILAYEAHEAESYIRVVSKSASFVKRTLSFLKGKMQEQ